MRFGGFWAFWVNDDPDAERGAGVACDGPHRHAWRHAGLALQVQEQLKRDPHGGDLYIFRGRRGDLAKGHRQLNELGMEGRVSAGHVDSP